MEEKKCVICGKKAEYMSAVNISPLCKTCMRKQTKKICENLGLPNNQVEDDDFYIKICDNIAGKKVKEFSFDLGEEYD